jgi:hypothetical protein
MFSECSLNECSLNVDSLAAGGEMMSEMVKLLVRYRVGKKVVLMSIIQLCHRELAEQDDAHDNDV